MWRWRHGGRRGGAGTGTWSSPEIMVATATDTAAGSVPAETEALTATQVESTRGDEV